MDHSSQIFRGLAYIHTVPGVCHRDVKPQNLLVSPTIWFSWLIRAVSSEPILYAFRRLIPSPTKLSFVTLEVRKFLYVLSWHLQFYLIQIFHYHKMRFNRVILYVLVWLFWNAFNLFFMVNWNSRLTIVNAKTHDPSAFTGKNHEMWNFRGLLSSFFFLHFIYIFPT